MTNAVKESDGIEATMKRYFFYLLLLAITAGCCKLNRLDERVSSLESRVETLENLCNRMNTNISSLQTIVTALQDNDYVTSITPVTYGDETIGYTISFSKSGDITVYHGKDGTAGTAPVIGLKQDSDENYYWTLNGDWLLDNAGNKIRANGFDGATGDTGAAGITPQLKIENGYWYVSYDNSGSWMQLGKATGQDGDSMFSDVTFDDDHVYLTLADGITTLTLQRGSDSFELLFAEGDEIVCSAGETVSVSYELSYGDDNTVVAVIPTDNWNATVEKTDNLSGKITVTAPDPMQNGEIIVLASDGHGKTAMKKLTFQKGILIIMEFIDGGNIIEVGYKRSTLELEVSTNIEYSVNSDQSWVSVSGIRTKTAMRNDIISFEIEENPSSENRSAYISIINNANQYGIAGFYINQDGKILQNQIRYTTSDGMTIEPDMAWFSTGSIDSNTYENGKGTITFNQNLTEIWDYAFSSKPNLTSIILPENITSIGNNAFSGCSSLSEINIPENVSDIGEYAFSGCSSLNGLVLPTGIRSISTGTFEGCGLKGIIIPNGVTAIGDFAFDSCSSLTDIQLPDNLTEIGNSAFARTALANISIDGNGTSLGSWIFSFCNDLTRITLNGDFTNIEGNAFAGTFLKQLYVSCTTPPVISSSPLIIPDYTTIYVPSKYIESYQTAEGWNEYSSQIVNYF